MSYESLKLERTGPVAEVVLTGPGRGNAMGPAFWRELPQLFRTLDDDENVRVVLLRGEGKSFSVGLDLLAMAPELGPLLDVQAGPAARTQLHRLIRRMQDAVGAVAECRVPVIAAVHGWCIGGGLDLASACDVRLCSADARFSLREVKVAIVADMGSLQRLPRIIGEGNTRELAFTGKDIDAVRARAMNLVNEVFPDADALLKGAREMAQQIAENPPLVVQGIKRVMNASAGRTAEQGLEYVAAWNSAFLASEDLQEAFSAFAEKRPPKFQGR
ncbi:MAG: crotonase/enoyl-CoA hydratase family protein [Myxococcota bacterium]